MPLGEVRTMKTSTTLLILCGLLLAIASSAQQSPSSPPTRSAASPSLEAMTTEADLYDALKSNDPVAVKRLLQQKVNLNHLYQPSVLDVRATAYHAAPFLY